jgi:hypothetical protein
MIWCASAALISVAVVAGRSESPSTGAQLLRLSDCAPPCWIGIVPGVTTFDAAYRRYAEVFGSPVSLDPLVDPNNLDPETRTVSLALPTTISLQAPITAMFYLAEDRTVQRISIGYEADTGDIVMPLLGDLVSALGPPQCVQVVSRLWMLVYSTPAGMVVIQLDQSASPLWNRPIHYLHFVGTFGEGEQTRIDRCSAARLPLLPWTGLANPRNYRVRP